jgi:hypothetical protein
MRRLDDEDEIDADPSLARATGRSHVVQKNVA